LSKLRFGRVEYDGAVQDPGHHPAGRSGQVELFRQGNERHLVRLEIIERHQQICSRAAPAVEIPNQYDVDLSGSRQALNPLSPGAIVFL